MTQLIMIGGIERVVGDKLEFMVVHNMIEWESLLKSHEKYKDNEIFFEEVLKLMGIKETENLRELILPISKKLYNLPDEFHIIGMMKQYFIFEPLSLVIHNIFMLIKNHFEKIVIDFVGIRNNYITELINKDNINELNDINELIDYWSNLSLQNNVDTSSQILYYLNPPEHIDNRLNITINNKYLSKKINKSIKQLISSIKQFQYPGFCPKVPYTRLKKLFKFPLNNFIKTIKLLNPQYKHVNYKLIENEISKIIKDIPINPIKNYKNEYFRFKNPRFTEYKKMHETNEIIFKKPQKVLDKEESEILLELIKWNMTKILELRHKLLPEAKKQEKYYNELAVIFEKVYKLLKDNNL
jgi:hypothetical protein